MQKKAEKPPYRLSFFLLGFSPFSTGKPTHSGCCSPAGPSHCPPSPAPQWGGTAREAQAAHAITPAHQHRPARLLLQRGGGGERLLPRCCFGAFKVQHQADKFLLPLGHISTFAFQPVAHCLLYSAASAVGKISSSLHIPNLRLLQWRRRFQPTPHAYPASLRCTRSQPLASHPADSHNQRPQLSRHALPPRHRLTTATTAQPALGTTTARMWPQQLLCAQVLQTPEGRKLLAHRPCRERFSQCCKRS